MAYDINSIQSLDWRTGVRTRIQMYLGTDDIEGTYQALKEIINNSTDEAIAGYGKEIEISVSERMNEVTVKVTKMCLYLFIQNPIPEESSTQLLIKTLLG